MASTHNEVKPTCGLHWNRATGRPYYDMLKRKIMKI